MHKIIHIVLGKANPNRMNGVNKVVHNLSTAQTELKYNVEVVGITNSKEDDNFERPYKLKIFPKHKFSIDNELKKYIKNCSKTTIFHIHGGFILDFYFISKLLTKYKFKYIHTSHGCYNKEAMKKNFFKKYIFFKLFDRFILKNAWKVQFLGESEYKHIDNLLLRLNKILVPNGINLNEYSFSHKSLKNDNELIFGFIGRIDSYTKGLDLLLEGFKDYKEKSGIGKLWIIGDGPDLKLLKDFSLKNNLNDSIIFWGSKFGEEKLNLIANMDYFLHTSRYEGFPMAVLDSLAINIPVLISKETNMSNYILKYNAGVVLDKNHHLNISNSLKKLELTPNQKYKIYINKMIHDNFDWNVICKEILS